MSNHQPVLLAEVLQYLAIKLEGIYVDGTFGRGGHSRAILAELGDNGRLIAFDQDPEAVTFAQAQIKDPRFSIIHANFDQLEAIIVQEQLLGKIDGILLDLGVSSPQLDTAERGFSFSKSGPLDMRMDPTCGVSAAEWLADAKVEDIIWVLRVYGEERFARRIANAIVAMREGQPITTTQQLADLIEAVVPKPRRTKKMLKKPIHPATRSFQAIRIFINDELKKLEKCLQQCLNSLKPGGRMAIISFHSLEDRITKQFFAQMVRGDDYPRGLPIKADQLNVRMRHIARKVRASSVESATNPRARSATLRVAEKIV